MFYVQFIHIVNVILDSFKFTKWFWAFSYLFKKKKYKYLLYGICTVSGKEGNISHSNLNFYCSIFSVEKLSKLQLVANLLRFNETEKNKYLLDSLHNFWKLFFEFFVDFPYQMHNFNAIYFTTICFSSIFKRIGFLFVFFVGKLHDVDFFLLLFLSLKTHLCITFDLWTNNFTDGKRKYNYV